MRATFQNGRRVVLAFIASAAIIGSIATPGNAEAKKTIGWSVAYFDHPVYQLMMKAAQKLADEHGCNIIFADGKKDPSVQMG